jgi:hypothetical protein
MSSDIDHKTVNMLAWAYSGNAIYTMRPEADEWRANTLMPGGIFPCKDGFIAALPAYPSGRGFWN